MKYYFLFTLFTYLVTSSYGSRVLCVMPVLSKSHTIVLAAICKELAVRQHEIVALTYFPIDKPPVNYKQIDVSELMTKVKDDDVFNAFKMREIPMIVAMLSYYKMSPIVTNNFLSHHKVVNLLKSDEKFDVIICEEMFSEAIMGVLSFRYKVPLIAVRTTMTSVYSDYLVGNPSIMSVTPDMSLPLFDHRMNLWQRIVNAGATLLHELVYFSYIMPKHDAVLRKHMGDDAPPLLDILRNTSLVLVNHHHTLGFPRAYVPNMVEIGGIQILKTKPLPNDLKEFMDNAKNGVIFFSLGTGIKVSQIPTGALGKLLEAFSRLKDVQILWKYDDETLPGKPDNVKLSKWLPQTDLLAHPNMKLFITHCGLGSVIETTYYGVPIVGIPVVADQPRNCKYATANGLGKMIDIDDFTAESLHDAIVDVLKNPIYSENAKSLSSIFRDRQNNAMDTVEYWVDYVVRHKGATHLRSAAQDLNWIQVQSVDVIGIVLTVVIICMSINYYIFKRIIRLLMRRREVDKIKKNK